MKVKVSKTIDMNQIPIEARRMIDQAKNNLVYGLPESMNTVVFNILSSKGEQFFMTIEAIDDFRKELASFDETLQEVQNILVGYKDALMPPTPEPISDLEAHEEQAEYEKKMSRSDRAEEGFDEER